MPRQIRGMVSSWRGRTAKCFTLNTGNCDPGSEINLGSVYAVYIQPRAVLYDSGTKSVNTDDQLKFDTRVCMIVSHAYQRANLILKCLRSKEVKLTESRCTVLAAFINCVRVRLYLLIIAACEIIRLVESLQKCSTGYPPSTPIHAIKNCCKSRFLKLLSSKM